MSAGIRIGLLINNALYCGIQIILLCSIIAVSCHACIQQKKNQTSPTKYKTNTNLFLFGLLFNIAAIFCIFALFYKALMYLINKPDPTSKIPIFFACNLVFLQNTFLMMVIFVRIYHIFNTTSLEIRSKTVVMFVTCLLISTLIFILLLTTKIRIPGTDSWLNCAVTLCIFNVIFAIWITSLFLKKLAIVFKEAIAANNVTNKNMIHEKDMSLIRIITKTTLLSFISMMITFISCLLLLFRFSLFGDSIYVSIISEWVISVDIYSNFACYSLSLGHYTQYYIKLCYTLDHKCRNCWLYMIFGKDTHPLLTNIIQSNLIGSNSSNVHLSVSPGIQRSISPSTGATSVDITVTKESNIDNNTNIVEIPTLKTISVHSNSSFNVDSDNESKV